MASEGQEKIYEMVTDRIMTKLEAGVVPWHKPWAGGDMPVNLVSKKQYRGVNVWLLSCMGFSSPYFVSYKQAQELGGTVKKGEKGCPVVFWKWLEKKDPDAREGEISTKDRKIPLLRYYTVFNTDQCEGIDHAKIPTSDLPVREIEPIEECELMVAGMPKRPEITHTEQRAYYRPSTDTVNMPAQETFEGDEEYYSTLFHELTHSTGHESRLNRRGSDTPRNFGDREYSKEELVAEMGAAYLCGVAGIENKTIDNSAAYIASWMKALRDDKKMVVQAAGQAQKAADFILDVRHGE